MIELLKGFNVARGIPTEVITGLMTGQYKLHGGVIRWAANTDHAGQVVRHLIPVASQLIPAPARALFELGKVGLEGVNTYQLHKLSGNVNELAESNKRMLQLESANAYQLHNLSGNVNQLAE
jgi:hypothetical protein